MLIGLTRLLADIEGGTLGEAEVYRRRQPGAMDLPARIRPGPMLCPICGTRALRFLPFGVARRRNARCPGCGSVERHRFLWLYLRERTDLLRRRHRLLHTAPEPFLEARLRALANLRYTSVDLFDPQADVAADLTDLPFGDGAFDAVITSHVLEHVADDRAAMAQLARVLRPGGRAIVMVPYDAGRATTHEDPAIDTPAGRTRAFGHPFHYRIYGRDITDRLGDAGFTVSVAATKTLFSPHRRRRHRINRNHLFDCVRR